MNPRDVWRILAAATVIGIILTVAAFFIAEGRYVGGVASGAFLGVFNLFGLIRLGQRLWLERPGARQVFLRFLLKYGGMAIIILVAFFVLNVEPLGFLAGVSNVLFAVGLYSLGLLGQGKEDEAPPEA